MKSLKLVAAALLLTGLVGCGPSTVTLTGTVTCAGKPVTQGHISVIGTDNIQRDGEIKPDGTFAIEGVPSGDVKIGVSSPPGGAAKPGGRPGASNAGSTRTGGQPRPEDPPAATPTNPNPVAPAYGDPNTSGLTGVAGKTPITVDIPRS